jgi:hypothetical protein
MRHHKPAKIMNSYKIKKNCLKFMNFSCSPLSGHFETASSDAQLEISSATLFNSLILRQRSPLTRRQGATGSLYELQTTFSEQMKCKLRTELSFCFSIYCSACLCISGVKMRGIWTFSQDLWPHNGDKKAHSRINMAPDLCLVTLL